MSIQPSGSSDEDLESSSEDLAFMTGFLRHQQNIQSFIYAATPNWDAADEVFQRVSLALWKKRKSYDPQYSFVAWAIGFAKKELKKYMTEQGRQPVVLQDNAADRLAGYFQNSEDLLTARMDALGDCLSQLGDKKRELVQQCYSSRVNIQQVAESLSTNAANVYQRLHRIRERLYDCITNKIRNEEDSPVSRSSQPQGM